MPGAHRNGDSRFCGASTIASQSVVKVNGKGWAVEGDGNSHGGGSLIAVYGKKNVRIGGKKVICAVGDAAGKDALDHPIPPTDPAGASPNVYVYEGSDGSRK
jgi:hypothetical protein